MPQILRHRPVRIGVRAALAIFVLVGFAMTAGVVEGVWWWTAQSNATLLAGALERQATAQVREDVASLIAGAEATYGAIATTLSRGVIDVGEEDKREVVFLAQLQGRPTLSWVAFGRRDGTSRSTSSAKGGWTRSTSRPGPSRARSASTATA